IYCADVQNFKIINDVFGVKKGDEVLKRIADMFLSLATGDTICSRLSADRFALCIREEKINHERYLEAVDKVCNIGEANSYRAQIYAGICPVKNVNTPISTYCDRAFLAIESIKGDYHQTIAYYDDTLRKQILAGQHMVNDFRSAIVKQEFQIFLQPLVNVSGKMLGAEALVRWFRPVHGMTLPEDFVEVFERSGLVSAMDQYVWELACKQLQIWKENGYTGYYISVNISPKDFYFMDIYRTLTTLVECYEISPHNLCLEITETSIMKDASKNLQTIDELRNYGFRVIMDDFGSGYSSLNMLQDMNLDAIKIDMEFLRKNDDPERSKTILEMILELSKELGIEVVTEGIEREDQLDYMQKLGCQLFQGYYFAKPMPVDQFERKYF
ncbi:MAG: putative bifunctional diguanylate cyclase/phosphodiesterase, partial [Wujia sp.]